MFAKPELKVALKLVEEGVVLPNPVLLLPLLEEEVGRDDGLLLKGSEGLGGAVLVVGGVYSGPMVSLFSR